jgi:hypothetical protein
MRSWWQQTALLLRYQMTSKMAIYQGRARKRKKGEVDQ